MASVITQGKSMSPELAAIIGDLVKTGVPVLGTLLGGALGYFTASASNRTQIRKQNLEYDLQLLKEAAVSIHSFDSLFQRYLYKSMDFEDAYGDIDYKANPSQGFLDEMELESERLEILSAELFQRNDDLLIAQSKLSLVGATETLRELDAYECIIKRYSMVGEKDSEYYQSERNQQIAKVNEGLHNDRKKL